MKEEYDELSEQSSNIMQSISEQAQTLEDYTQQYQTLIEVLSTPYPHPMDEGDPTVCIISLQSVSNKQVK